MMKLSIALIFATRVTAFVPTYRSSTTSSRNLFFADETEPDPPSKEPTIPTEPIVEPSSPIATESNTSNIQFVSSDSPEFLNWIGKFLVDAFWMNSDHHGLQENTSNSDPTPLIVEQCADLQDKYGEVMGTRLAPAQVIAAMEGQDLLGVVTVDVSLQAVSNDQVLDKDIAEQRAKQAVAQLGPKERRLYKGTSMQGIADKLLSSYRAVVVLSNLAVAPQARRKGIGRLLCEETEALAQEWGFDSVHLLVEEENLSGRALYERMGYRVVTIQENAPALRADLEAGTFRETTANTLVMEKVL